MLVVIKILIMCCFSFLLSKGSSYGVIVVSPVESYLQKKQAQLAQVDSGASDNSLEWKRRHKRRKKSRRPQRGR